MNRSLAARIHLVPPARRRDRGLGAQGGASLLLHGLALLLLLVWRQHRMTDQPSPSNVAMVFQDDSAPPPQSHEGRESNPAVAPDQQATRDRLPGAAAAPPPAAAAPPVPSPRMPQPPPPEPSKAVQTPRPPVAPPRTIRPRTVARPRAASSGLGTSLSAPMDLSFGGAPPPASRGRAERGVALTLAPTDQNRNIMTRYADARRKLGGDWFNQLQAFVEAHKYYPAEAGERGEDGEVELALVVERDGRVRSMTLLTSSGSVRLDAAFQSLFRSARLPPFPAGTTEDEISFSYTMQYMLVFQ